MEIDKSDFVIFDEEKCREIIIDLIQANPGYIAEAILNKLKEQNLIGRKKFYRILSDLKKENIIKDEEGLKPKTKNAKRVRNKQLVVNGSNPLAVILNELEGLEKLYYLVLEKTVDVFNKRRADAMSALDQAVEMPPPYEKLVSLTSLLWNPFHILIGFLKNYLTRLITIWSKVIQDKDVMSKLYSMIFAKFAHIQSHSFKIMVASISEEIVSSTIRSSYTVVQDNNTQQLKEHIQSMKKYGMENETKELLDMLEAINANEAIRQHFYAQNKPYQWDLRYKDEEMKSLFEEMRKHPDYIYDGLYDDYVASLEG